ncbi:SDR family oxidoreductase [Flexithrix dorotheae]|uniref:SDR family oxidoreductase n=1 Tax=Flexithrix dorotheae TaxID=70993 RepID=UPI0003696432|nr:SDR family oxidoreductase [Flexithrix dorotheae]
MDTNLTGKNALVCGSTQGIGKAVAISLASLGANVTLMARNEIALKEVILELDSSKGQQHSFLVADFFKANEVKDVIQEFSQSQSAFHILVNNTGGPAPGSAYDANTEDFLKAFSAHLVCNQHLTQVLVPLMKKGNYGRIINIISTSVKVPIVGLGVSNTTRGAVASWAKTLATELGQFGITVNNVLPGLTKTGRLDNLIKNRAEKAGKPVEEYEVFMQESLPAKRFAQPEEVANAVAFLASPAAAYINGINLPVDGGSTPCL